MIKNRQNINILELSEQTPTSKGSKFGPNFQKNSSFSKENNFILNNINTKKKPKILNIKTINNQEGTTTHDETISKLSNSQKITKKKKHPLMKSASYKNKKRERERIINILKNSEKIKIPTGKRKSNVEGDPKMNLNNIENMIKKHKKERKDSFGNTITKENKKNVHINFKDFSNKKKLIELIPIESFKSFNLIEENKNKTPKPYCSRCCSIF